VSTAPRRAHRGDLLPLLALITEFYEIDAHEYDEERIVPALEPMLLDDALGQVWVLEDESRRLDGYLIVTWTWSLESGGRDCIVDEIYVREPGHGPGARLLEHGLAEAVAFGARAAFLETEAPNDAARRFYVRHGFVAEDSIWMSTPIPRTS
jgi:GNAT superfamily N-acetyltransferase